MIEENMKENLEMKILMEKENLPILVEMYMKEIG